MNSTLAVITPQIGSFSETFVRRHVNDLLPGKTVVIANNAEDSAHAWSCEGPLLSLASIGRPSFSRRLRDSLCTPLGAAPWSSDIVVKEFLQSRSVEVILSEYLDLSLNWMNLANELGIRFFAHGHGYDISSALSSPSFREKYRQLNTANGVFVVSDYARLRLIEVGIRPELIHVKPCGVDIPREVQKRHPNRTVACLAVGRMVPKKSPIFLLEAFRQATKRHSDLHLNYVGDGILFDAALQFVTAMQLTSNVTLHRSQNHDVVKALLVNSDIFLQHCRTDPISGDEEGLPVAILEAMANGLPVVSTRHAGIPEAVLHNESGFLEAPGDSIGMAKRIVQLAEDFGLRQQMGRNGRDYCQHHFSWETEKVKLLELLGL